MDQKKETCGSSIYRAKSQYYCCSGGYYVYYCVWHEATWDLGTAMEIVEASFLHRLLMPGKDIRFAGSLFAS